MLPCAYAGLLSFLLTLIPPAVLLQRGHPGALGSPGLPALHPRKEGFLRGRGIRQAARV